MSRGKLVALLLLVACLAPAAHAATVSKCIWREEVMCDASPAFIIAKMPTLTGNPAESDLAVDVLQVAAMQAACHVFEAESSCVSADGCLWDHDQAPSCNVDPSILVKRDVFKSGCPTSLMEAYVRCGAAINKDECKMSGMDCNWSDELEGSASHRRLSQLQPLPGAQVPGAIPTTTPRACMPKQLFLMDKKGDKDGIKKIMKQIASQDLAVWGECNGTLALRAISKLCGSLSSPGTCKANSPLCRWNDMVRGCVATGAGHAAYVLGPNSTAIADGAKSCARANGRDACLAAGTVSVDPKLFISVQKGNFGTTTNSATARTGAAAVAAATAAAALGALLL